MFDVLSSLNDQQKNAVLHEEGPAIVLAGAGSGKTRVLVSRVVHLMQEKQIPADHILLVTFTNKAGGEMTRRVQEMSGMLLPFSGTYHRLCSRILRKDGFHLGLPFDYVIFDDEDQLDVMKNILKRLNLSPKEYSPRMILGMISKAKTEMISAKEYSRLARGKFQEVASKSFDLYEKALRENSAVDFDDLLNRTVDLFMQFPEVLDRYQQQFEYVLVDEYQDVNRAQYLLTTMLGKPQNNLFCVGDFSQSIYGWRGADFRNMLLMKDEYSTLKEYRLEQNYRSSQPIVEAARSVIAHNTSHPVLDLWTDKESVHKIALYEADSETDEAEYVIRTASVFAKGSDYSSIAILYRTNAQSRVFEDMCMRYGIPYRLVGGLRFYARKEIKDVLAYLRLVVREDEVALRRIEKLGKRNMQVFRQWLAENKKRLESGRPSEILDEVLENSKYLDKYDDKVEDELSRIENVKELRSVASHFETMTAFLENIALVEDNTLADVQSEEQASRALTMMSMHAAKGLEFDTVFLVGLEEGLFPHSRALLDRDELEEERRLCYVGITRARERLYLCYARKRLIYGTISGSIVSRFVAEVPEHLIERQGLRMSSHSRFPVASKSLPTKHVSVDDPFLEAFLSDEIDVDTFLGA